VLGAGGAARAVARSLGDAGAAEVVVVARRAERGGACAKLAGRIGRVGSAEDAGDVDVIVNATPVGMDNVVTMDKATRLPIDPARLGPGQLVVDLVYEPLVTPLVAAARERGVAAVNGIGMLIHQAALAFRLWTGEDPPMEAMSAAALTGLASRD
jgi:shikimate dehydrogenase